MTRTVEHARRSPPSATAEHRIATDYNSFGDFKTTQPRSPERWNGSYLDYVFTTPMRVSEYENVVPAGATWPGVVPSDHMLQRATVHLP